MKWGPPPSNPHTAARVWQIIIKGAIGKSLTTAAKDAIKGAAASAKEARSGGQPAQPVNLGTSDEMLSLVNRSKVTPILNDLIGDFDAPASCQVGVLPPREAGDQYTPVGWRDADVPCKCSRSLSASSSSSRSLRCGSCPDYGANTHMDGICTIFSGIPQDPKEVEGLTHDEKYRHYVNAGNPDDHW